MSRVAAEVDEWVPGLSPSADLGHSYGSGAVSFAEFRRRYLRELRRPRHALTLVRMRRTASNGVLTLVTTLLRDALQEVAAIADDFPVVTRPMTRDARRCAAG